MEKTGIFYKLKAYCRRARIKKPVGTHTFRHTLATEMLKAGADLRHIQEQLGHGNLSTTQKYLHIVKAELKKVHAHTHPREAHTVATPPVYHGAREV
jgi:integrase/recombinase XerD